MQRISGLTGWEHTAKRQPALEDMCPKMTRGGELTGTFRSRYAGTGYEHFSAKPYRIMKKIVYSKILKREKVFIPSPFLHNADDF